MCPRPPTTCENTAKNTHAYKQKRNFSTGPGTEPRAVDIGVCISETKHNRKSRVRTRCRDTGGRLIERGGTRADVNKPRAGASTALTISGIFRSVVGRSGRSGPRSEERGRRYRKQHKHSDTQDSPEHALLTYEHDRSRPTLRSRLAPMQFTSPHPAPDWLNGAARASDDLALQRAPPRAPRALRPSAAPRPPLVLRPVNHECRHDDPRNERFERFRPNSL